VAAGKYAPAHRCRPCRAGARARRSVAARPRSCGARRRALQSDQLMTEAAASTFIGRALERRRLHQLAEGLGVAVAVPLPWSTRATSGLVALWLIALLPTLELASLRSSLAHPAGGLPVALWTLAVIAMLWSDVPFTQQLSALSSYHKLLV